MEPVTEPVDSFLEAAVRGTILGIILGSFNQVLVSAFLIDTPLNRLVSFVIGGLVAGAIQGAFLRRHIPSPWIWLSLSSISWLIVACWDVWLSDNLVSRGACYQIMPYILIGAFRGIVVGLGQSLVFCQHPRLVRVWIVVNILLWPTLLVVAVILDSFFPTEGGCSF